MNRISFALPLVILAACSPIDTQPAQITPALPDVGTDTCGARDHAGLLRQPVTTLHRRAILKPVRVIRPDSAVTMDYLEHRVNFYLDDADTVQAIACG
ncbi:MAG: I78 family peptidase inhibitor [Pseudomonadota bacterium]